MSYCFLAGRRCSALAPLPVLPVELAAPGRGSSREVSLRDQVPARLPRSALPHPLLPNFLSPLFYIVVAHRLARLILVVFTRSKSITPTLVVTKRAYTCISIAHNHDVFKYISLRVSWRIERHACRLYSTILELSNIYERTILSIRRNMFVRFSVRETLKRRFKSSI